MNKLQQWEFDAMKQVCATVAPKKPIVWQVVVCKQVLFENEAIQLAWHYIRQHNLNTKPITKR